MHVAKLVLAVGVFTVIGCGGSGGGDGGTTNPPPATVATVTINRSSALLKPTESVTLTATAKSSAGATINGRTVSWNNSNSSVTSMTPNGASATVTGSVLGTSSVTATVDQVTSSPTLVTVTNNFPSSASITVGAGGQDAFDPAQADVASGATVTFSWQGVLHNVTWDNAPSGAQNSGDKSTGTYQATINAAGTFNYHCTIHPGMNGSITVH
jgi:plastocyanin